METGLINMLICSAGGPVNLPHGHGKMLQAEAGNFQSGLSVEPGHMTSKIVVAFLEVYT